LLFVETEREREGGVRGKEGERGSERGGRRRGKGRREWRRGNEMDEFKEYNFFHANNFHPTSPSRLGAHNFHTK